MSGAQDATNGVMSGARDVMNGVTSGAEAAKTPLATVPLALGPLAQSNSNAVRQKSTGLPTDQGTVMRCPAGATGGDVCFGSKADVTVSPLDVRFTGKGDIGAAQINVRWVP